MSITISAATSNTERSSKAGLAERFQQLRHDLGIYMSRRRDRKLLLQLDDRTLADISISRELLETGVKAWPWRINAEDHVVRSTAQRYQAAVKELESYSDSDLADLGISRGAIRDAVLYGRPGVDVPSNDNVVAEAA